MVKQNVILNKSFEFALDIIAMGRQLKMNNISSILIKQLIRSATSIGANVEEAIGVSSKKDFVYKMSIAYKEARESNYWLRLLRDSELLELSVAAKLVDQSEELNKILFVIIRN